MSSLCMSPAIFRLCTSSAVSHSTRSEKSSCAFGFPSSGRLSTCQTGCWSSSRLSGRSVGVVSAVDDDVAVASSGEDVDMYPSGEWPANFSMSNYEDLSHHYAPIVFKKEAQPGTILANIMSKEVWTAASDTPLSEISHHFDKISGVPVVDSDLKCVGVLSRKDVSKAETTGLSKVGEAMTSPPVTISAGKTVSDAAVLMLKNKVHRLPVVNESDQVVGIVTRTDIFNALEGLPTKEAT